VPGDKKVGGWLKMRFFTKKSTRLGPARSLSGGMESDDSAVSNSPSRAVRGRCSIVPRLGACKAAQLQLKDAASAALLKPLLRAPRCQHGPVEDSMISAAEPEDARVG
jgi:hypothetical protein